MSTSSRSSRSPAWLKSRSGSSASNLRRKRRKMDSQHRTFRLSSVVIYPSATSAAPSSTSGKTALLIRCYQREAD